MRAAKAVRRAPENRALAKFVAAISEADTLENNASKRKQSAAKAEKDAKVQAHLMRIHAAVDYLKARKVDEPQYRKYGVQGPFITEAADQVGHPPETVRGWFEAAFVLLRLRGAKIRALENLCGTSLMHLTLLRKREKDQLELAREAIDEGLSSRLVRARAEGILRRSGAKKDRPDLRVVDGGDDCNSTRADREHPDSRDRQQLLALMVDVASTVRPEARNAVLRELLEEALRSLDADDWTDCEPRASTKSAHRALLRSFNDANDSLTEAAREKPLLVRVGPRSWVTVYDRDGWERACDPGVVVQLLDELAPPTATPSGVVEQRARVVAAVEEAADRSWGRWRSG